MTNSDASPDRAARQRAASVPGEPPAPPEEPTARDIDVAYRESDRLYYEVARGCGISECAMWLLYHIVVSGGRASQARLVSEYCYSRSTANSALKSLESKGLIELVYAQGSRRNKDALLTAAGKAFCDEYIQPAIDAESRAFQTLTMPERVELVRLVRLYSSAMHSEFARIHELAQSRKEKK